MDADSWRTGKREDGSPVLPEGVAALERHIAELEEKYETPGVRCHSGHVNHLPVSLWDCPICTEERKAAHDRRVSDLLEANNREVERRRAAEAEVKDAVRLINGLHAMVKALLRQIEHGPAA